jgi:hypothetical protein
MADDPDGSICIGDGSSFSLGTLARFEIAPDIHRALYEAREQFDLNTHEHLLARLTPQERQFIEHVYQYPESTDEELMCALGVQEATLQAYYGHLRRNFKVATCAEIRRWAIENGLVSTPVEDAEVDQPADPPEDPPEPGFDPWVRWY